MGRNSGDQAKKYGHAGTKRGRFNSNPTMCNHVSCNVLARAKQAKVEAAKMPRHIQVYKSKAISYLSLERM